MPPQLALVFCLLFVGYSLGRDLRHTRAESKALWLPSIWVGLSMSRPPSFWLNPSAMGMASGENVVGSIWDRGVFVVLLAGGVIALAGSSARWKTALRNAPALLIFAGYCAVSISWSDVPLYALRRYVKFVGMLMMILIVVSESDQMGAVTCIFRRSAYVLVPVSLLFIKYFPELGRGFDFWTGVPFNRGVAFDKNMLGKMCLVITVALTASILQRWRDGPSAREKKQIWFDVGLLGLTLYLFTFTHSATCEMSAIVGVVFLVALRFQGVKRYVGFWLSAVFLFVLTAQVTLDLSSSVAEALGRDPTLTNRTLIWDELLAFADSPLLGTGYESFWAGEGGATIMATRNINEAHNGYLEIYLNLGLVGLFIVLMLLISTYARSRRILETGGPFGQLALTLWLVIVTYDIAEAGLSGQSVLLFLFLLLAIQPLRPLPTATRPLTSSDARSSDTHMALCWRPQ